MSRMRVTAAQILADCPLVVGFGGWGVLGSELPATGEHGPSVGYEWADLPADNDKEFWVRITTQPASGTLLMWPDSAFEYDGPSTTFEAQLAVGAMDVGTPQTVTLVIGAPVANPDGSVVRYWHLGAWVEGRLKIFRSGTWEGAALRGFVGEMWVDV